MKRAEIKILGFAPAVFGEHSSKKMANGFWKVCAKKRYNAQIPSRRPESHLMTP